MPVAVAAARPQWWQDLRWIAAGTVILLACSLAWGLFGPEPPITVSPNTTYLTEPLAADGLPDYGAALLAAMGPAPEPEDNAAVELLQVLWPLDIDAADLPAVCGALGIPAVPPANPLQNPTRNAATKVTSDMLEAAVERPWTGAEFPELEAWLVAHEAALDRLVAAADRPRLWLPDPVFLRPGPHMLQAAQSHAVDGLRQVKSLLVCRAMGHVGAGRHAAAWRDIRAVHRFARLLAATESHGPMFYPIIAANSIQFDAGRALTRGPLGSPDLPADVLAMIRQDLESLGPPPEPAPDAATERLCWTDSIVWLARRTPGGRTGRLKLYEEIFGFSDFLAAALLTSLDWNIVLQRWNANCDRFEAAARLPTWAAREAEVDLLEREARGLFIRSGWATAGHALWGCCSREYRSVLVGDLLVRESAPALNSWLNVMTRSRTSFDLCRTAAALAAWKADRAAGEDPYPETLAALVPKYLAAVPLDPFADKPFVYERRGEGYLLASVGPNGVYDGGDDMYGWIVGGEWRTTHLDVSYGRSDQVVRMPVPPPLPATP